MGALLESCKKRKDGEKEKLQNKDTVQYVLNNKDVRVFEKPVDSEESSPINETKLSSVCVELDSEESKKELSIEICQEGYLKFRPSEVDNWVRKWCTCNGTSFRYYKNDKMTSLDGVLLLHRFSTEPYVHSEEKKYGFRLYNSVSNFQFSTESPELQKQWLFSLRYLEGEDGKVAPDTHTTTTEKYPSGDEIKQRLDIDVPEIIYHSTTSNSPGSLTDEEDDVEVEYTETSRDYSFSQAEREAKRSTVLMSYTVKINQIERLLRKKEYYVEIIDTFLKDKINSYTINDFLDEYHYIFDE